MPSRPHDPLMTGTRSLIGYDVGLDADTSEVVVSLEIGAQHLNLIDTLHGGVAATLLDTCLGLAASRYFADGDSPRVLTLSLTTDFVASPQKGTHVEARGRVEGGGHKICYARGELRGPDGTLFTRASAVLKKISEES